MIYHPDGNIPYGSPGLLQVVSRVRGVPQPTDLQRQGLRRSIQPQRLPPERPRLPDTQNQAAQSNSCSHSSSGAAQVVTFPLLSTQPQMLSLLRPQQDASPKDVCPTKATMGPNGAEPTAAAALQPTMLPRRSQASGTNAPIVMGITDHAKEAVAASGNSISRLQQDEETQVARWPLHDAAVQSSSPLAVREAGTSADAQQQANGTAADTAASSVTSNSDEAEGAAHLSQPRVDISDGLPAACAPAHVPEAAQQAQARCQRQSSCGSGPAHQIRQEPLPIPVNEPPKVGLVIPGTASI